MRYLSLKHNKEKKKPHLFNHFDCIFQNKHSATENRKAFSALKHNTNTHDPNNSKQNSLIHEIYLYDEWANREMCMNEDQNRPNSITRNWSECVRSATSREFCAEFQLRDWTKK